MENKLLCTIATMAVCISCIASTDLQKDSIGSKNDSTEVYDGYNMEYAAENMKSEDAVSFNTNDSKLIFEKDTFNIGTIVRSKSTQVKHIACRNVAGKDIHVKNARITNNHARVSTSPIIPAGAEGTILCILDMQSISVGEHVDKITIQTNSKIQSEYSIFIKYDVIFNQEQNKNQNNQEYYVDIDHNQEQTE